MSYISYTHPLLQLDVDEQITNHLDKLMDSMNLPEQFQLYDYFVAKRWYKEKTIYFCEFCGKAPKNCKCYE